MRVVYVSYDGALDPLGASQVCPYLEGFAQRGIALSLVSFEKPKRWAGSMARDTQRHRFESRGIRWRPLIYHRRPRLAATTWDVLAGMRAVRGEVLRSGADLVHCRGDVALAMARWARLPDGLPILYDMRGFYADERVETGSWRRGSMIDRCVRRAEVKNLRRAGGMVVLTEAARDVLRGRHGSLPPLRVIPTCVDTSRFTPAPVGAQPEFGVAYCGSLGTWYMTREMVEFAREAAAVVPGRPLFLTPQAEEARTAGATADWAEVRSVSPGEVPEWLRRSRVLFFFVRPTPAKRASCPTKLAEGLATGLPIVANGGVGDIDRVLEPEGVGVLVGGFTKDAYREALGRLGVLLSGGETASRCRRLAVARYSVEVGVEAYVSLYHEMLARRGHRRG